MPMETPFVCYASKRKTMMLFVLSAAFVILSTWLIIHAHQKQLFDRWLIYTFSLLGILFFGFAGVYILIRLRDVDPVIVVNGQGILNRTNASGKQFIPWDEITGIETAQMKGTQFLLVYVQNPKKYIGNGNFFQKILMGLNHKTYGTPISITPQSANCTFGELSAAIESRHPANRN